MFSTAVLLPEMQTLLSTVRHLDGIRAPQSFNKCFLLRDLLVTSYTLAAYWKN